MFFDKVKEGLITSNSRIFLFILVIISLALIFSVGTNNVAAANQIYVNGSHGDDNNNGLSWTTAKSTIKNATRTVNNGGKVKIAVGTYTGTGNTNIVINKNIIIIGESQTGTIIDGANKSQIFKISLGCNVTIQNLTLKNGYEKEVYPNGGGGAIYNGGNLIVINTTFENNTAHPTWDINTLNDQAKSGGAIYNSGLLTLKQCTFTNNSANPEDLYPNGNGGAIDNEGTMNVETCTFNNNTAKGSYGWGGAIYNVYGTLNINNSIFKGNIARWGGAIYTETRWGGGPIYTENNACTIKNSTFTSNIATERGSSICEVSSLLNIENSSFTLGNAEQGAIYTGGNCTISGCNFTNNKAIQYYSLDFNIQGGAIYVDIANCTVNKCNFTDNTANEGGAIYNGATCNTSNSIFTGNKATAREGGAFYNSGTGTINSSTFSNNMASDGSAIYNVGTIKDINTSTFTNNNADQGTIDNNGVIMGIENSKFTNNIANLQGGAIYNVNPLGNITNCNFINNSAINAGGAIYNYVNSQVIKTSTFTGNTANNGGAIFNNLGINYLQNSNFSNNKANNYGGAIYNYHGIFEADYSKFTGNRATNLGGAIFNDQQQSELKVIGSSLINNIASVGSAIYTRTILDTINFNYIYGNTGSYDIYSEISPSVDLRWNWWGTNFIGTNPKAQGRVNINVKADPWILLKINASSSTIKTIGTDTITANLRYDSIGQYHSPSNGHIPDGIPVTFTTTIGTINNKSFTVNGIAQSTLKSRSTAGTTTISAKLDNQTVKTTVTIKDTIPPKVSTTIPTNLKTGVSRTSTIVIKFSENIKASTYYSSIKVKNLTTGKYVTITKSISGNTLYIKMTSTRIAYNWYQVTIPAKAIKDYAGNNLLATYAFKFKTGA